MASVSMDFPETIISMFSDLAVAKEMREALKEMSDVMVANADDVKEMRNVTKKMDDCMKEKGVVIDAEALV